MRPTWLIAAALLGCLAIWQFERATAQDKAKEKVPLKQGLATFHIGNSLTNTTSKFPDICAPLAAPLQNNGSPQATANDDKTLREKKCQFTQPDSGE